MPAAPFASMVDATFQLCAGIGPVRERRLWEAGIHHWDHLPDDARPALSTPALARLKSSVEDARRARREGNVAALAALMPTREHWRLFPNLSARTAYLDIETDGEDLGGFSAPTVTAISILDASGPQLFLAGRNLGDFPASLSRCRVLVTFNGSSFDVPVLQRFFPGWCPPPVHIDMRHLWARLGETGGLKAIERRLGIGRPPHLDGIDGFEAIHLWRRAHRGDRRAMRLFVEYNLYDTVNLRTLMTMGYNRMIQDLGLPLLPVPEDQRGDILNEVSTLLLRMGL